MASSQPNEDLFEESRMSFREHLEDLRKVIVRALIGIALGCVIGFYFANTVVEWLNQPLIEALSEYKQNRASEKLVETEGFLAPELIPWLDESQRVPDTVMVDPGQLVEAIRNVSPDFLDGVQLNHYGFLPAHFDAQKLGELCKDWLRAKDTDDERGKRLATLWSMLKPSEQFELQKLSEKSGKADNTELESMVRIFDRLANLDGISDSDSFQELVSDPEAGFWSWINPEPPNPLALFKKKADENKDPVLNRRLNRVLITGMFPDTMPAVKLDMVPIQIWRDANIRPQSLGIPETFLIWVKAGLVTGILIASPWVLFQFWSFIAAGLYPHEKKQIHIFLPISLVLFFCGVFLAFGFVFQPVLSFLFTFNAQMGIDPIPRINDWLGFVLFLPLGFGVAFQLPLVMFFLNRIGVFSTTDYLNKWRVAVMVIFVLSMILTPADPVSMILLAAPLTALYFIGILMCHWMPAKSNPFDDSEAAPA